MEKSYFIHNINWNIDTTDDLKRLPVATILTFEVEGNETKREIAKRLENEITDTYKFCAFIFDYIDHSLPINRLLREYSRMLEIHQLQLKR